MKLLVVLGCSALTVALLSGCATADQQAARLSERRAEVAEAVRVYADQLVVEGQPHAVFSAQPRPIDKEARYSPYILRSIDGKPLARPDYSFTKAMPLQMDLAFSALKVPTGKHDLVIFGGAIRKYATEIKGVEFAAGRRYAVFESRSTDDEVVIYVAEYRPDARFAPHEPEYYLKLGRVSDAVVRGSDAVVPAAQVLK